MFFGVNLSIRRLFWLYCVTEGVGAGNANARPNAKFANAPRQARDWQGTQMPRSGPEGGRGDLGAVGFNWNIMLGFNPRKFRQLNKWNWIGSMKFEKKRIHFVATFLGFFSSKVFATMATWRNGFASLATLKFWDIFQTYESQQIAQV